MGSCQPSFSMPNGRIILVPLILGLAAVLLSFKTLSSCDMITTEWDINCSTETTSNCLLVSQLKMGLLARETLAGIKNENQEVQYSKVCQWNSDDDSTWLLDPLWVVSKWCIIGSLIYAVINICILFLSSCYKLNQRSLKRLSISFGILSILTLIPMMIYFASDVCREDVSVCDPTETNCVGGCKMGSGSWQLLASSITFLSTMISILTISSHHSNYDQSCDPSMFSQDSNIKRVGSQTDSESSNDSDKC